MEFGRILDNPASKVVAAAIGIGVIVYLNAANPTQPSRPVELSGRRELPPPLPVKDQPTKDRAFQNLMDILGRHPDFAGMHIIPGQGLSGTGRIATAEAGKSFILPSSRYESAAADAELIDGEISWDHELIAVEPDERRVYGVQTLSILPNDPGSIITALRLLEVTTEDTQGKLHRVYHVQRFS